MSKREKIPYYFVEKSGRGYWSPKAHMRAAGFYNVACGVDGPIAREIARQWVQRWREYQRGEISAVKPVRFGTMAYIFGRFRQTSTWASKAHRTREDWERGWKRIELSFGSKAPRMFTFEDLDRWYAAVLSLHGVREAHRAMKIWRALWQVAAAMGHCSATADPSRAIRRKTPPRRSERWLAHDVTRLISRSWSEGYFGLACAISIAWDTLLSPVDVRRLSSVQLQNGAFVLGRAKTGQAAVGTISDATLDMIESFKELQGASLLPDAPILRNRSGQPYSKDTMARDFRKVRELEFGLNETRMLMDLRRSGALEALAGGVDLPVLAAKLANTIADTKELQRTYLPAQAATVRIADRARIRGRRELKG